MPALCVAGALLTCSAPLAASSRVAVRDIRIELEIVSLEGQVEKFLAAAIAGEDVNLYLTDR